jgi:hypothetical protein
MSSGEIALNPVDIRGSESLIAKAGVNRLRAGEILVAKALGMRSSLNCYIETINHSFRVNENGAETLQCTIVFSRGLFEHQEDYIRKPTIPLKKVAPAVERKTPPAVAPSSPPDTSPSASSEATLLFNGVEYPYSGSAVKRMLLRTEVSRHLVMRTDRSKVDILVAHYTDGPANTVGTNAANCRRGFNTEYERNGKLHVTQTQFIIDHDGTLWQVLDAGRIGYHAGNATAARSIGVELAVPSPRIQPRASDVVPWEKLSGFYVVNPGHAIQYPHSYGPSLAQRTTLAALAKWANTHLAVPLVAPAAVPGSKGLFPLWSSLPGKPAYKLSGGLWHHVEVQQGHADCMGLSLLEIVSLAEAM